MPDSLDLEIKAFEKMKDELLQNYIGKYVIFHHQQFVGAYDNFDNAAKTAFHQFGKGPYLIRQVGSPTPKMPISLAFGVNVCH